MTPTTAEFIAQNNPQGVSSFAREHGYDIAATPEAAYGFLVQAWESDKQAVLAKMKDLHPHGSYLFTDAMNSCTTKSCHCKACRSRKKFNNFEDVEVYAEEVAERLKDSANQVKETITPIVQNPKDHTKEILTYGAVLLAGIFIGKYLIKS